MVKMKGKILELGTVDKCNRMFSEDCDIKYLERVPVTIGFFESFVHPDRVVGTCLVSRDGNVFTGTVDIFDGNEWVAADNKTFVGGYYGNVEINPKDGILIVNKAILHYIAIIQLLEAADESLYLKKIEEG